MDGANHHALPFPAAPKHSGKEFSLIIIIIIIFLPAEISADSNTALGVCPWKSGLSHRAPRATSILYKF